MGRVAGSVALGRASLLAPTLPAMRTAGAGAGWKSWGSAAISAARAGIQKSIDSAYIAGGTAGAALPAGALLTRHDLAGDVQRALQAAGAPPNVAAAFAGVTDETVAGWAAGFSLKPATAPTGPLPLSKGMSSAQWRLNPGSIESGIRTRLGAEASTADATAAIREFSSWLGSSLSRWQMQASITKWSGAGVLSGPPF